jgi:hypothetical protein
MRRGACRWRRLPRRFNRPSGSGAAVRRTGLRVVIITTPNTAFANFCSHGPRAGHPEIERGRRPAPNAPHTVPKAEELRGVGRPPVWGSPLEDERKGRLGGPNGLRFGARRGRDRTRGRVRLGGRSSWRTRPRPILSMSGCPRTKLCLTYRGACRHFAESVRWNSIVMTAARRSIPAICVRTTNRLKSTLSGRTWPWPLRAPLKSAH